MAFDNNTNSIIFQYTGGAKEGVLNNDRSRPDFELNTDPHVPDNEKIRYISISNRESYRLFGPTGSRLSQIAKDSGVKVVLEPSEAGRNDRIITLGPGHIGQIWDAVYLLRRVVEDEDFALMYDV